MTPTVDATMDIRDYNRRAWDREVERNNPWTQPVGSELVAAARRGELSLVLTPQVPVPKTWYPPLEGADVLCLASGGGQQAPLLAAAGAHVTLLDNSPKQLGQDRLVAEREDLKIHLVQGDMADLSSFPDDAFDLIFHPVSNCFAADVNPVWRECFRVTRTGGRLLAGFANPARYIFDQAELEKGELLVRHSIPYSDLTSLTDTERARYTDNVEPLELGHSLDDQIGGQLRAGFVVDGFYEDRLPGDALSLHIATYMATRATKLATREGGSIAPR